MKIQSRTKLLEPAALWGMSKRQRLGPPPKTVVREMNSDSKSSCCLVGMSLRQRLGPLPKTAVGDVNSDSKTPCCLVGMSVRQRLGPPPKTVVARQEEHPVHKNPLPQTI